MDHTQHCSTRHDGRKPRIRTNGLLAIGIVLFTIAAPSGLRAQTATPQDSEALPEADEVLDRYVEVSGGEDAYAKLHNRMTKGTIEFVGTGIKGPTTSYAARPNKVRFQFEVPSVGEVDSGVADDVVWEVVGMTGPQIKDGDQRAIAMREAVFDNVVQWRKLYKKAECVGVESVEERPCYKLKMTPHKGPPETHYYDKETGLLAKVEMTVGTAMGNVDVVSLQADYKEIDGILLPHKVLQIQKMPMGEQRMIFESLIVKHNVDLPEDIFKVPDEIQALLDKPDKEDAESQPKPDADPDSD